MVKKEELRLQRAGTIINFTSKAQETALALALKDVATRLQDKFGVELYHEREWRLVDVVSRLRHEFPELPFADPMERSSMRPDGGVLSILDREGKRHTILIVEVKNQGTNDLRAAEGKAPQAKGNAIERLGKNVIGFRTAMLSESIMPFVCFGYGCDFNEESSILDRVVTIAMFGPLNEINVLNQGEAGQFNRGSFFFREQEWSSEEMADILFDAASRSVHYYYAKYGSSHFAAG